jgi:dipeptidyl aminopeptidase/acylaminoacyl peptidase
MIATIGRTDVRPRIRPPGGRACVGSMVWSGVALLIVLACAALSAWAGMAAAQAPTTTALAIAVRRLGDIDVWVVDEDGSNLRRVTTHPAIDGGPSWSPDGERIAFSSKREDAAPPNDKRAVLLCARVLSAHHAAAPATSVGGFASPTLYSSRPARPLRNTPWSAIAARS